MVQSGPYILCEDLFKIYKIADLEVVALRGLDLAVEKGELPEKITRGEEGDDNVISLGRGQNDFHFSRNNDVEGRAGVVFMK